MNIDAQIITQGHVRIDVTGCEGREERVKAYLIGAAEESQEENETDRMGRLNEELRRGNWDYKLKTGNESTDKYPLCPAGEMLADALIGAEKRVREPKK